MRFDLTVATVLSHQNHHPDPNKYMMHAITMAIAIISKHGKFPVAPILCAMANILLATTLPMIA